MWRLNTVLWIRAPTASWLAFYQSFDSWPCSPLKCLPPSPCPQLWKTHVGAHSTVQQRDRCSCVCGRCIQTLWGLSAGTMQAAVLFDCTAVNLSNISAASTACALGRSRPPLTGDLNVFVYWSLTPTNQFSTMWSHPAQETQRAFIQMQLQCWFAFIMYFVACMLYTHDAKFNSPIFLPLNLFSIVIYLI